MTQMTSNEPTATIRTASCRCGALTATCTGEPVRVSVCHCLECQKRSGSAFAAQARWPDDRIVFTGAPSIWATRGDGGRLGTFRFCPTCGATIAFVIEVMPGVTAVPLGAFADPTFPAPAFSVYEQRKHAWVAVAGEGVEHFD